MPIFLNTRKHRIHFDGGYRDVPIHEVTDSELDMLRFRKWTWGGIGLIVGTTGGFAWAIYSLHQVHL